MRRSDYSAKDNGQIETIAFNSEVGYLGIIDPNEIARTVPLNFILKDNAIFFHGADEGEKFNYFSTYPNVSFSIIEPYSMIPSYWVARDYACPATQFYKSILFSTFETLKWDKILYILSTYLISLNCN